MKIGYMQFRPLFGQVEKNLQRVLAVVATTTADLIVLPELAFTGYHFADRNELSALADDPRRSATVGALTDICAKQKLHMVAGYAERSKDRIYNSALLIGPTGILHIYRKIHLFLNEKNYFDPGDIPFAVQNVQDVRVGMMICFDWAFPEVARTLMLRGADVLCHPSNLVLTYCQQTMRTRCLENRVYAVTANRFGEDRRPHGTLRFTGKSQIVAPNGEVLKSAPGQRQECVVVDIDPQLARQKSLTPLNDVVTDRRPDYYQE